MTILVTGGAGFIGINFLFEWLKNHSENVINFDKLTYAANVETTTLWENEPRYKFFKGDISDKKLLLQIFNYYKPRAIINFAAESHVDRSIVDPEVFIQTNIVGTFRLLESTLNFYTHLSPIQQENFRFIHISTDEVYGSLEKTERAFLETSPYAPNSPYAASKASSDHWVRAYYYTYGLPTIITHCSNNYGPYQFPEKLIPLTIKSALSGNSLPIYGDGTHVRDWIYVKDHCEAIIRILNEGKLGETYNIGGLNQINNLTLVNKICNLLDKLYPRNDEIPYSNQIKFVTDRPGHDQRYALNINKIQQELRWSPFENFETGIFKTVMWYLKHTDYLKTHLHLSEII